MDNYLTVFIDSTKMRYCGDRTELCDCSANAEVFDPIITEHFKKHPGTGLHLYIHEERIVWFTGVLGLHPLPKTVNDIHLNIVHRFDLGQFRDLLSRFQGLNLVEVSFDRQGDGPKVNNVLPLLLEFPIKKMVFFDGSLRDGENAQEWIRRIPEINTLEIFLIVTGRSVGHSEETYQLFWETIPKCIRLKEAHLYLVDSNPFPKMRLMYRAAFNQSLPVRSILAILSVIDLPRKRRTLFLNRELIRSLFTYML
jgi:hypothetical protein